eukprot:411668_1
MKFDKNSIERFKYDTMINFINCYVMRKKYQNEEIKKRLNLINARNESSDPSKLPNVNVELMHRLLIENCPQSAVAPVLYDDKEETILEYILQADIIEDIGPFFHSIIDYLLKKKIPLVSNSSLFYPVFKFLIANETYSISYLQTLHDIIKTCDISPESIYDEENGANPLHLIINSKQIKPLHLSFLCDKFPHWMSMGTKNAEHRIPLLLAIEWKNFDAFYIVCRRMLENKIDINSYLRQR